MNYFDIKFLHQFLTVMMVYSLMIMIYNPNLRLGKILYLFTSLMMVVSGALSMDRLKLLDHDTYPMWLYAKLGCLFLATVFPILMAKFVPKLASKLSCLYLIFIVAAVFLGIYKP